MQTFGMPCLTRLPIPIVLFYWSQRDHLELYLILAWVGSQPHTALYDVLHDCQVKALEVCSLHG